MAFSITALSFIFGARMIYAERPESQLSDSPGLMSSPGSFVMLNELGIGQRDQPANATAQPSFIDPGNGRLSDARADAPNLQTLGETEAVMNPNPKLNGESCGGAYGSTVLNERMTVVSLDTASGCDGREVFAYFVGGNVADCKPISVSGCQQVVIARYSARCDLSPLYNLLAQTVPFTQGVFDKDGVYTKCKEQALLERRIVRYIGSDKSCSEDFCGGGGKEAAQSQDQSGTVRASTLWIIIFVCGLVASVDA